VAIDPETFIPEKYLTQKEFLVELTGHGWGIIIPSREMGAHILSKRIHPSIIINRDFVTIIHETAMSDKEAKAKK
jgi:hypothetical protein